MTTNSAELTLGNGQTTLTVASAAPFTVTASNANFRAWVKYEGSLGMLCDPGATPGATQSRYSIVAQAVAQGGLLPVAFGDLAPLLNKTFYAFADCAYSSASGTQGQDQQHDGQTVSLTFDGSGNGTTSTALSGDPQYYQSAQLSQMLAGTVVNGQQVFGYKVTVNGAEHLFLVNRLFYSNNQGSGVLLSFWLDE